MSEQNDSKSLEDMGLSEEDYVWDKLKYESLDETPEGQDTVEYESLLEADEERVLTYADFKSEIGILYATTEDDTFDEDLYQEFENLVDDQEGHQFFLAHIEGRPICWQEAMEAFLEHQRNLTHHEDVLTRLLQEQQAADVTPRKMQLPASQSLRITQEGLDD